MKPTVVAVAPEPNIHDNRDDNLDPNDNDRDDNRADKDDVVAITVVAVVAASDEDANVMDANVYAL